MKKLLIILVFASFQTLFSQTQVFKTKVKFENVDNIVSPIGDSVRIPILNEAGVMQSLPKYLIITQAQQDWIRAQMYENLQLYFYVSAYNIERGVPTDITLSCQMISNDDVITAASINQGIGSVLDKVDTGEFQIIVPNVSVSTSWSLTVNYLRNGESGTASKVTSISKINPKWMGASETLEDVTVNDYALLNEELTKVISNLSYLNFTHNTTNDEYVWFISPSNINKITASGFDTTIGSWGDPEAFFWKKSLTNFKLSNGIDTVTLYLYRSRLKQNTGGNDILYVFNP